MGKAQKYMNTEVMVIACRGQVADLWGTTVKRRKEITSVRPQAAEKDRRIEPWIEQPKLQFTPLNALPRKMLMEIRNDPKVQWPFKMRSDLEKRNNRKFCHFHDDHGHDTEEYIHLKKQIEALIQQGRLQRLTTTIVEEPFRREAWEPENQCFRPYQRNDRGP